jgi:F-type H+-transporting ATPase subunit a
VPSDDAFVAPRPQEIPLFALVHSLPLIGAAEDGGFHPPSLEDFFPPAILFDGTPFEINRITLVRLFVVAVVFTIFILATRRAKVVPGRFQGAIEMVLDFVRNSIVYDVLGEKFGRRYVGVVTTIFISIFFMNITGVIPFLNIAGTSLVGMPLMFALWVYVLYLGAAVKEHGPGKFLKAALFPPGVPKAVYLLLTPIEFLQVFFLRPATLAIRLLANMMAGHLLLALTFVATSYLFFEADAGVKAFGLITLVGGTFMFGLEIFVAALQAYVFAMLTSVYLQMVLEPEH